MARFFGAQFNGLNSAKYQIVMDITETSAASATTASGNIIVYLYAAADVVGGYNFNNGNSLSVTKDGASFYSTSNVGSVKCQNTGTLTQIYSSTWSKARSSGSITFVANFKQTQDTRYSGSVSGTLTFQKSGSSGSNQGSTAPIGYLDEVTVTHINGWTAYSKTDDTSVTVRVKIYDSAGTTLLHTIEEDAINFRQDLVDTGYGNGKHGYSIFFDFAARLGNGTYVVKAYGLYNNNASEVQLTNTKTITSTGRFCEYTDDRGWVSVPATQWLTYANSKYNPGVKIYVHNGSTWKANK